MDHVVLSDKEFLLFQRMIYQVAGIHLADNKKYLVSGRLAKRVQYYGLKNYGAYYSYVENNINNERQMAVDLLTTNETCFFRESQHFDYLRDVILPEWTGGSRRLWSAASSSGEEAYTIAMILSEHSKSPTWDVIGTDLNTSMIERATRGQYAIERAENIPPLLLSKYCLKGTGAQSGTFLISRELRKHTHFIHANLKTNLSDLGEFDIIFLRNVLIYFDQKTKQSIVNNLIAQLKPGAYFIVGRSETLSGVSDKLLSVSPSIYRKPT